MIRIIVVLGFLLASSVTAATLTGLVVAVADGDTITVLQDQRQHKVRLAGIDCPERAQAFGTVARQRTAALVFQQPVSVVTTEKDRYGRWIGIIVLPDGRVLNATLVDEGLCWHYVAYSHDPVLATLEAQARAAKRGLWGQTAEPVPPWEFRRHKPPRVSGP